MNKLQEAVSRVTGYTEDTVLLQTLARGSSLFCKHMERFKALEEAERYTEAEQRHAVRITKAFIEFHNALDGDGSDPMLWLGILAQGRFSRPGDVILWPIDAEWCDYCGCYKAPVEDSTRKECSNAFCDSLKERA